MPIEYEFELNKILGGIKEVGACFVGLQFPEGLKEYAVQLAEEIEGRSGAKAVIFTDQVYGACDMKEKDSELLGLDLIVHLGHTELVR
ncbi:MAG: diphthamide synthesis protein [Candidatus Altiarchaeota archaeon]|nr:diphthamide synthesis protein [Candidatus Altiarchaeota archaeon]